MVHPALLSRNFSKLPPYLQPRVSAAVYGSVFDLATLCDHLGTLPQDQLVLLLPVFFILLDPSLIPRPERLDAIVGTAILPAAIEKAIESLKALAVLADSISLIPTAVVPDLWPRVWRWMDFFQTYWNYLPGLDPDDELPTCVRMATILNRLQGHRETAVIIWKTRGVRKIFARVWANTLYSDEIASDTVALHELHRILRFLYTDIQNPAHLEDLLDGAGGTEGFVYSLKMHITYTCAAPPSEEAIGSLGAALKCATLIQGNYERLNPFLLSEDMVATIVMALRTLSKSLHTGATFFAHLCLFLLDQGLLNTPQLVRALEAGLLPLLIPITAMSQVAVESRDDMSHVLGTLFSEILPRGLTSYRVVTQLRPTISDAMAAASDNAHFQQSPLFEDWMKFEELAKSRIEVLDSWESAGKPLLHACDNLKCGLIKPKSEFKSCSGCQSAAYCSRSCQTADWQETHRDDCYTLLSARQRFSLPFRDRAFLRAIFHADHERMRLAIARRTVGFLRQNPGIPYCTAYNYREASAPTFEVGPQQSFNKVREQLGPDWVLQWRRMARSEGRMELNVLMLPQGFALFPTRSSSSKYHDGLSDLATAIAPDALDTHLGALMTAVEDDPDFVEIH
ncbi:hypothetical protein DFH06DRAFT_1484782 [Mycena polygramma]|nr:hypothetical protein DFH06DRAFT_1484782 [Mycena polygramma]